MSLVLGALRFVELLQLRDVASICVLRMASELLELLAVGQTQRADQHSRKLALAYF